MALFCLLCLELFICLVLLSIDAIFVQGWDFRKECNECSSYVRFAKMVLISMFAILMYHTVLVWFGVNITVNQDTFSLLMTL